MNPSRVLQAQLLLHDAGFTADEILLLTRTQRYERHEQVSKKERNDDIERRFRAGEVMDGIGGAHGISRERVRQILEKRGIFCSEGGSSVRSVIREKRIQENKENTREDHIRQIYGCSLAEMKEINGGENASRHGTIAHRYASQRVNAATRAIKWEITLPEYARIWKESGKFDKRGRGAGKYCMARRGDEGPYSADNVYIILNEKNGRDGQANSKDKFIQRKWSSRIARDEHGYRPRERQARDAVIAGADTPRKLASTLGVCYGTAYSLMRKVQAIEPHLVPRGTKHA